MSNALTHPAPLDALSGPHARQPFQPLRWLRTRLFSATRNKPAEALAKAAAIPAFPPPIGRGYALRRAHRALQQLFAEQEGLCQVLPHLNLLERALAKKGSKALRRLAMPVLHSALEELEDLQSSENHPDLATLRTRIVEVLALRSVITQTDSGPGATLSHYGVEVQEASHSAFDEELRRADASMRTARR